MISVRDIPLSLIDVPAKRMRDFDPTWADALARLIGAQGLIHPILLREKDDGRWALVAGRYRLEAVRLLGWDAIAASASQAATDEAAMMEEVYENLGRAELIALDRCRALFELKEAYEKKHPQAKWGGDRRSLAAQEASCNKVMAAGKEPARQLGSLIGEDEGHPSGFALEISEKINLSWRAIQRCVKIWKDLSRDSRRRLVGTPLAVNQSELQLLSQQKPGTQARILDLILDDTTPYDSVRVALDFLEKGKVESSQERKFTLFADQFSRLPESRLDQLAALHADRMIAALKRLGRI